MRENLYSFTKSRAIDIIEADDIKTLLKDFITPEIKYIRLLSRNDCDIIGKLRGFKIGTLLLVTSFNANCMRSDFTNILLEISLLNINYEYNQANYIIEVKVD